jgi:DNA-binding transcriptional LysR family regulator
MRITLKQLEVFIAVAQEGNVTRAAGQLNITQSATSMALADFETQLRRRLFDRVGKRLQLNDAGRLLLPKAIDAVARASEIETLAASDNALTGSLRIGASLTIGNYLMPGLIGRFMRRHPGTQMQLKVGNTRQVVHDLEQFHVDIGFIEGFCHAPDIEVQPWGEDELVVFCAADHPLAAQPTVSEEDLSQAGWILREPGSGTREVFDNAVLGRLRTINLVMELGHTEAIIRSVEAGLGISCASRLTLADALEHHRLVILPTPFLDLRREFFLLVHRQKYRTQALEHFLQFCKQQEGGSA